MHHLSLSGDLKLYQSTIFIVHFASVSSTTLQACCLIILLYYNIYVSIKLLSCCTSITGV